MEISGYYTNNQCIAGSPTNILEETKCLVVDNHGSVGIINPPFDQKDVCQPWPYSKTLVKNKSQLPATSDLKTRKIDSRTRRYWNTLVEYFPLSGFKPAQGGKVTVLDIGCGFAYYASSAKAYFEGSDLYTNDDGNKVKYFGLDIDFKGIKWSAARYANRPGYKFIQGDGQKIETNPKLPSHADIIIIRHPEHHARNEHRQIWINIFKATLNKVKPKGRIIFTCSFRSERNELIKILSAINGYEIILEAENPFSVARLNSLGFGEDSEIVIAKRR